MNSVLDWESVEVLKDGFNGFTGVGVGGELSPFWEVGGGAIKNVAAIVLSGGYEEMDECFCSRGCQSGF